MRIPIPIEKIAFNELSSAGKKASIPKVTGPKIQVSAPAVPTSTPQLNAGTTTPVTMNQVFIGLAILALVGLVLYLKHKKDDSYSSSYTN